MLQPPCAPRSPEASSLASGTKEHPVDVRTPSDHADSVRTGESRGTPTGPLSWDTSPTCAPVAHPDDDLGLILSDITAITADDELVRPGLDAVELPTASSEFSLPEPRRGPVGSMTVHRELLSRAQRLLQDLRLRDDSSTAYVAGTVAYIKQILLDDTQFVAGNWHHFADLWTSHLRSIPRWPQRSRVLAWIRQGYPIDWVDPDSEVQQTHPRFKIKRREGQAMLEQVVPLEEVPRYMTGTRPSPVVFPNRRSALEHDSFTDDAIRGLVHSGMAVVHDPVLHDPVIVVNPLAVVVQRTKKRLVVDLRYVNRFVRYEPVRYEQLSDVLAFVQRDWYAVVTDLKSGYHHLRLRRKDWPYLAVHWKGRTLLLTHLPFGLASACAAFTAIQAAFYRPLRSNGSTMAFLIDDRYAAAATPQLCALDGLILALAATALGTFFSSKKADWHPKKIQRFLGLEVDTSARAFKVPTDKKEYFMATVRALLDGDAVSARQLAHVAGLIISMSMAVNLCPMFTRRLFLAMISVELWDALFPTPAAVREELQWW